MTRPAAGWLPYLILPLGVALLEYHGLQFWTLAVTGAWPGWFTLGFWAAWSAWGWAVLLEAGALWCWMQSRPAAGAGPWVVTGWTVGGAVLTGVLCVAALWNVAAPVRQNLVVSQLMAGERERVGAQEDAAQGILLRSDKPYRRLVDNLERSQARAAQLFQDALAAAKEGRATSDAQARLVLLLQVACVVLGQLLVVAAARAMGTTNGEADGSENWRRDEVEVGRPRNDGDGGGGGNVSGRGRMRLVHLWDNVSKRALPQGQPDQGAQAPQATQEVTSAVLAAGAEEAVSPHATSPAAGTAEPAWRPIIHGGAPYVDAEGHSYAEQLRILNGAAFDERYPDPSRPAGLGDAAPAGAAGVDGGRAAAAGSVAGQQAGRQAGRQAGESPQEIAKETGAPVAESPGPTEESADEGPEAREPVVARVKAVRALIEARWPMENQSARAGYCNVSERDLSLLMHHERLAEAKRTARHTKIISENALARIERAVGIVPPAPEGARRAPRP